MDARTCQAKSFVLVGGCIKVSRVIVSRIIWEVGMGSDIATAEILEIPKHRGRYGEGSCYQRQDNSRWEISFYDNEGRRRRESFSTEAKARKALTRKLALKEAGKLDAPEGRTKTDTISAAYLRYIKNSKPKSYKWAERVWRLHLEPFFGGRRSSRVGTDEIDRYVEERKTAVTAGGEFERNGTVNRELSVLKAMYNHASRLDPPLVSRVPRFPKKLRESNPRSGWLDDEQYEALQTSAKDTWLRGLLAVAYTFGFRKAELLNLKVGQVNLKDRTIQLLPGTTKNDKGRTVKMTEDVYQRLVPCMEGKQKDDALFSWSDGSPVKDFRVCWEKMCEAAKVPILLHDFRRSAIRNMIRAGVPEKTAMRISGHVTRSVFDRYDIGSEDDLAEAAERIENRRNGRKLATESSEGTCQSGSH
jgi:integrase